MFHILGSGSIGTYIAHKLYQANIPTKLILTPNTFQKFQSQGSWTLKSLLDGSIHRSPIPVEMAGQEGDKFKYLFVTTKANTSLNALKGVWDRVDANTTLIMLQNGMGVINEVMDEIIANQNQTPKIFIGTTTHGCYRESDPFTTTHAAHGEIWLGLATSVFHPNLPVYDPSNTSIDSLWNILKGADLNLNSFQSEEQLFLRLMDKLLINCTINPICGILNQPNGAILKDQLAKSLIEDLCAEYVHLLSQWKPLQDESTPDHWKHPNLLEAWLYKVTEQIKLNTCSMVQDLRARRSTEIEYMNGYLLNKAKQLDLNLPMNQFLKNKILKLSLEGYQK